MCTTTIQLSETDDSLIGKGGHRLCFAHPYDKERCVKIVHSQATGGSKELERELKYYRYLSTYLRDWRGIPRYYGTISTNLGTGYVYDRIVDYDGQTSLTMVEYFTHPLTKSSKIELVCLVNHLFQYLFDNRIITMTLKPYNILCHRISEKEMFPVICDNLGEASFIPIASRSRWFCHLKQRRIFRRFLSQPVINQLDACTDGIRFP